MMKMRRAFLQTATILVMKKQVQWQGNFYFNLVCQYDAKIRKFFCLLFLFCLFFNKHQPYAIYQITIKIIFSSKKFQWKIDFLISEVMMIWAKMMEMTAYLNQSWKKIDRYLFLQSSPNSYILKHVFAYSYKSLNVCMCTETLFLNGFSRYKFLLNYLPSLWKCHICNICKRYTCDTNSTYLKSIS